MDLGLSTSTKCGSIALFKEGQLVFEKMSLEQKSHSEIIHSFIDEGLKKNKSDWSDLQRIFLDIGPGSFTGIRVSLNLAKSLSYSLRIPIFPFHSLEIMAFQAQQNFVESNFEKQKKDVTVLTIINAFKNMVYYSEFDVKADFDQQKTNPVVLEVQKLPEKIKENSLVIGDGYKAYESFLQKKLDFKILRNDLFSDFPNAKFLGPLFEVKKSITPSLDWKSILPLYIRASEAEENKRGILFKPLE